MNKENKFFRDFYDGQIVKEETEGYKLFKVMLVSIFSVFGLFFYLLGWCNLAELILLECGMIWNVYTKLNKKIGVVFCVVVGFIYFVVACNFRLYANALIYIAFYIPFQLIALTHDYSEGDFVQIRKKMGDYSEIIYVLSVISVSVIFYIFSTAIGGRFSALDAIASGCLVASAFLRNERYNDYYSYRFLGLCLNLALWIWVAVEYDQIDILLVIAMYLAYIIFDVSTCLMQRKTYVNQYMVVVENYKKQENEKLAKEKLKIYNKSKEK